MNAARMSAHFRAERAAGAQVTRIAVDAANDKQFSREFRAAKAAGLRVMPMVNGSTSTGAAAYARRARWVARTYARQGVTKIELGNEWNLHGFAPQLAVSYQKAAYAAIKSVCSHCIVVSNGLAAYGHYATAPGDGGEVNPVKFLEQEYAAGLHGSFDELGWHPYNYNPGDGSANLLSVTDAWSAWAQMGWLVPSARSLMVAHGDGDKRITATEWGVPTDDAADGFTGGVSPQEQATMIAQGIALWKQQPWAGDLIVYEYQDIGNSATDRESHFGLVDWGGTAKPALAAYENAVP
jgi:hypothetical protein